MAFEKNKLPVWNLGGSLNERDPPSEVPAPDVISVNNWKPDKDGKSKIKRPGYELINAGFTSFNEPIRGIFHYIDPDSAERIVIVTTDSVVMREDIYTWTRKWQDTDSFYNIDPRAPFVYQNKLCFLDQSAGADIKIMESADGETWSTLDTYTPTITPNVSQGQCASVFADEIFFGLSSAFATDELVCRYDGSFNEELPAAVGGQYTIGMHNWDGKLWILVYRTAGYTVYSYDGASYSLISNYDGAAELPSGSAQLFNSDIRNRIAKLFTWNNVLHLAVSTKDGGGKWTWEIHAFNVTLYDRFNKIYDSSGVDDYCFCSYFYSNSKAWVIVQKFEYVTDADPDGNDNKIYSSPDLNTWTEENGSLAMGMVMGEAVFEGKVSIGSFKDWAGARTYQIWTWDSISSAFVSEINIATNAAAANHGHGDIIEFQGNLYAGKYREIHKRTLSTNTYTEIYSTSEEIPGPVPAGTVEDGRLTIALDQMVTIEGNTVYSLGLQPPVSAPTLALSGDIVIDATNNKLDFEETDGVEITATLTNATYSTASICAEIKAQMEAAGASTYTVTFESGNVFKIASDGAGGGNILNLLCFTGSNAAASVLQYIGFGSIDLKGAYLPELDYTAAQEWALTGDSSVGGFKYVVTFQRSGNYPVESNPSPESAFIYPDAEKILLTNIPVSPDPKCNARRLYRTTAGGEIFFWFADISDNTTTTLTDRASDNIVLGGSEVSYDRGVPPIGPFMEVWDNRLWIAGVEGYENFLYFTNTGTSEEMADANFIQVKARESDRLRQIKAFGDRLIILKTDSGFRLSKVGSSLYELEQLPQNIGTNSSWSVVVCDKFLIWKSPFGIEVFNGNSCFRPISSDLVERTLATLNPEAQHKNVGGHNFDDGEYWLGLCTGSNTEPDTMLVYNYIKRWFTIYTFPEKLTYLMSTTTRIEGLMFLTGTEDGNVYIQGRGFDDNGTAINSHFQTGHFNVTSERELNNVLRRMWLKYQLPDQKTLTMEIYADQQKTKVATASFVGTTPTDNVELRNDILARQNLRIPGTYVSFKFINNEKTGGECKVVGYDLFFNKNLKMNYGVKAD
ncbi:hypothetical protein LCGC14_0461090 [marine sediment metagenome]|uniref:Uncharacterized protein n=1 Tax=marine sediment metagenome TaxID=412755 RepID=A0A0F9SXY8_9ZZZZ|nr:hypothetical protein [bacterium]